MKSLVETINHVRHFADNADIVAFYRNSKFDRNPNFALYMARTFVSRADRIGMTKSEINAVGKALAEAWVQSTKVGFFRSNRY
jgi:hypothetical protein